MKKLIKDFFEWLTQKAQPETHERPEIYELTLSAPEIYDLTASIMKPFDGQKYEEVVSKLKRLTDIGLVSSVDADELRAQEQSLNYRWVTIGAVEFFSERFPNYKFLKKERIQRIGDSYKGCRYRLFKITNYPYSVPEKNLVEIEQFPDTEDYDCYEYEEYELKDGRNQYDYKHKYMSKWDYDDFKNEPILENKIVNCTKMPLYILHISGSGVSINIVLKPVIWGKRLYYFIVTNWQ